MSITSRIIRPRRQIARASRMVVVTVAVAISALATLTATAGATVYTGPGHAPVASEQWGDCYLQVGAVRTNDGAAMAGVDISCGHTRGYISADTQLWHYTSGGGWQVVAWSGWRTGYGWSWMGEQTPAMCGAGYWMEKSLVNVDGARTILSTQPDYYNTPC